jgi:hypothetical protein
MSQLLVLVNMGNPQLKYDYVLAQNEFDTFMAQSVNSVHNPFKVERDQIRVIIRFQFLLCAFVDIQLTKKIQICMTASRLFDSLT